MYKDYPSSASDITVSSIFAGFGDQGGDVVGLDVFLEQTLDTSIEGDVTGVNVNIANFGGPGRYAALFNGGSVGIGTETPTALLHVCTNSENNLLVATGSQVGIGVQTPMAKLHVLGNGGLTMENNANNAVIRIRSHTDTATQGSYLATYRSRGTSAMETAVQNGDFLGSFSSWGLDSDGDALEAVAIETKVDGTVTSSAVPGAMYFRTAGTGGTLTNRMVIKSDGKVGIGTTSPGTNFHVNSSSSEATVAITGVGNSNTYSSLMLGGNGATGYWYLNYDKAGTTGEDFHIGRYTGGNPLSPSSWLPAMAANADSAAVAIGQRTFTTSAGLTVSGAIAIGDTPPMTLCGASTRGIIRFDGSDFYGCTSTGWTLLN